MGSSQSWVAQTARSWSWALERRRALLLVLAAVVATACLAAAAAPSLANIEDPSAEPNHGAVIERGGVDYAEDVVIVGGYVYVCGQVEAGATDADASLLRMTVAGGATALWASALAGRDHAVAMAVAPGGGALYTSGTREGATDADILVIKWSKSGRVIWKRTYDPTPAGYDAGGDIVVDRDGNITVFALAQAGTRDDWLVVSWTATGKRRWVRRLTDSPAEESTSEMVVDRGGNLYVTGYADRAGKSSMLTVKLSRVGRVLWKRWYLGDAGLSSAGHALALRPGGGVYVAGLVANTAGGHDGVCVAYRSAGTRTVADPVAAGEATVSLEDLAVLTDGTIVGVGWSALHGPTGPFLCRWDRDGHVAVSATIATPFSDTNVAVAPDSFGGYCVAGTYAGAADASSVRVLRDSDDGAFWYWTWAGPTPSSMTRPKAVIAKGNVVAVCGDCISAATGRDQFVMVWRY
jgi:hypothetical protein